MSARPCVNCARDLQGNPTQLCPLGLSLLRRAERAGDQRAWTLYESHLHGLQRLSRRW